MSICCLKWDVGCDTKFSGKISDTLWTSVCNGMYTTQFFMGSPYSYKRTVITDSDIKGCKKILEKYPLHIFTHFPYTANLAGSTKELAWENSREQDTRLYKVIKALEYELGIIGEIACPGYKSGVVIHPGSFPDRKKGLLAIAKTINKIKFPKNSVLLLENSAGAGTSLATTFSEIKVILDNIVEEKKQHIQVCIDTCHIYACGVYNIGEVKEVEKMFSEFDSILGLDKLGLIHLNDSCHTMETKKDRHACLGDGCIWGKSYSSLITLLEMCSNYKVPLLLETTFLDMYTLSELGYDRGSQK